MLPEYLLSRLDLWEDFFFLEFETVLKGKSQMHNNDGATTTEDEMLWIVYAS